MLKRLILAVLFVACLCGQRCVSEQQRGGSNAVQSKPGQPPQLVPPTHVVIDPPFPASVSPPPAPVRPEAPPEKVIQKLIGPEWVIVYVTALYALIAWFTFRPIQRQAKEMSRQNKNMISRERARLTLEPQPITRFEIDIPWDAMFVIIRNYGYTHAFNVRFETRCEISKSEDKPTSKERDLSLVSIVLTNAEGANVSLPMSANWGYLKPGAEDLYVHLWGICTYEDVFGGVHSIKFRYIFNICRLGEQALRNGLSELPVTAWVDWKNYSDPEDDLDPTAHNPD